MVVGMYRESGRTLREFCENEGLEVPRVERWLRRQEEARRAAIRFVEVERKLPVVSSAGTGKYRLGFANGSWLEVEGGFEKAAVRELVEILREEKC